MSDLREQLLAQLNYVFSEGEEHRECRLKDKMGNNQGLIVEYAYSKILTAVADAVAEITTRDVDGWIQESLYKGRYPVYVLGAGAGVAIAGLVKMFRTQAESKEEAIDGD